MLDGVVRRFKIARITRGSVRFKVKLKIVFEMSDLRAPSAAFSPENRSEELFAWQ